MPVRAQEALTHTRACGCAVISLSLSCCPHAFRLQWGVTSLHLRGQEFTLKRLQFMANGKLEAETVDDMMA